MAIGTSLTTAQQQQVLRLLYAGQSIDQISSTLNANDDVQVTVGANDVRYVAQNTSLPAGGLRQRIFDLLSVNHSVNDVVDLMRGQATTGSSPYDSAQYVQQVANDQTLTPTSGISPVSGSSSSVGNGLPSNYLSKTTAYTASANDFVEADVSGAGFTVTLPTSPAVGALVAVKKIDSSANTLTIAPASGGSIDGNATTTTSTQWAGLVLEHKGSNVWRVAASMSTTGPAGPTGPTGPAGPSGMTQSWYADGSDGSVTFDGTSTVAGIAPSGNVYTLTRSLYLNNATVNSGVTVYTNSCILNVKGTLTVNSGGIVSGDGRIGGTGAGTASGASPGANGAGSGNIGGSGGATANVLGYGRAGGLANSSAGTASSNSLGGAGGAGGSASGGATAGGAGGAASGISAVYELTRMVNYATVGWITAMGSGGIIEVQGGGGGGGAANDGVQQGGGGGGGGQVCIVNAYSVANNGQIRARGAAGASALGGNSGGGGGGGGGVLIINCASYSGTGTYDANGGAGGAGAGTGAAGTAGSAGTARLNVWP